MYTDLIYSSVQALCTLEAPTAAEENRPPVHVKPVEMPDGLEQQAKAQAELLNKNSEDLIEAQRKVT